MQRYKRDHYKRFPRERKYRVLELRLPWMSRSLPDGKGRIKHLSWEKNSIHNRERESLMGNHSLIVVW